MADGRWLMAVAIGHRIVISHQPSAVSHSIAMYDARRGSSAASTMTLVERLNGPRHELALRAFTVIVLAHWGEHLLQAYQIYGLGWPVPEARGLLGYFYPMADQVGSAALRLRARDAGRPLAAAAGIHRAPGIASGGRSRWGFSSSTTSSTCCCSCRPFSATTSSAGRCRPASCSSGCRASSCTSSTTPSCSSRW